MAVTRGFALAMAGRSGAGDAILVLPKVIVCGACAVVALISLGGTSVRKPSAPIATTAQRPTVASVDLYEALFGRRMVDAILATPVSSPFGSQIAMVGSGEAFMRRNGCPCERISPSR
jgi:hypothetical protein